MCDKLASLYIYRYISPSNVLIAVGSEKVVPEYKAYIYRCLLNPVRVARHLPLFRTVCLYLVSVHILRMRYAFFNSQKCAGFEW